MASMLVDSFADDFRPEDYTDDYREELQQLIDAKLEGEEAFPTPEVEEEGEDAEVVDLLAALQRSVERHKGTDSKSGGNSKSGEHPSPPVPGRAARGPAAQVRRRHVLVGRRQQVRAGQAHPETPAQKPAAKAPADTAVRDADQQTRR